MSVPHGANVVSSSFAGYCSIFGCYSGSLLTQFIFVEIDRILMTGNVARDLVRYSIQICPVVKLPPFVDPIRHSEDVSVRPSVRSSDSLITAE